MRIIWSNREESLHKKGIHLYDQTLLKKIMIPYRTGKLRIKRIIYIHEIETDKQYEVIEENLEYKKIIERILKKTFSAIYKEQPKKEVWMKPVGQIKKTKPTYELDEEDWKKPKKRGGVDKWV